MSKITYTDYPQTALNLFTTEKQKLQEVLPEAEVHHIGSTAIPGVGGKGIVDILVAIPDWGSKDSAITKLRELGFVHIHPEKNNRIFTSRVEDTQADDTHIHLTYQHSDEYRKFLTFRDFLRTHLNEAKKYSELKKEWLQQAKGDREAYGRLKDRYVANLLKKIPSDTS